MIILGVSMRTPWSTFVGVILAVASLQTASATSLNFTDIDMRTDKWAEISKFGSVSESSALIVNSQAIQISTSAQLFAAAYKTDISWHPATLGRIVDIAASGSFLYSSSPITPVSFLPILVQGGNVYAPPGVAPYLWEPPNAGVRQDHQWSASLLPISVFGREIGSGPGTPDFSPGAPPVFFGFAGRRDGGGATYRFGNVAFSVTGVPEPSTLTLCASMLAPGLAVLWRRQVRRGILRSIQK